MFETDAILIKRKKKIWNTNNAEKYEKLIPESKELFLLSKSPICMAF